MSLEQFPAPGGTLLGCRVWKQTGAITLPASTPVDRVYDSQDYNDMGMWAGSGTGVITCKSKGRYLVTGTASYDQTAAAAGRTSIQLNQGGGYFEIAAYEQYSSSTSYYSTHAFALMLPMNVGDQLKVQMQSEGAARSGQPGYWLQHLEVQQLVAS